MPSARRPLESSGISIDLRFLEDIFSDMRATGSLLLLGAFLIPTVLQAESGRSQETEASAVDLYREAFDIFASRRYAISEFSLTQTARPAYLYSPPDSPFWQHSPMGRLKRALATLHEAGAAPGPVDWGVTWEESGFDGMNQIPEALPHVARMATIYHEVLLEHELSERIDNIGTDLAGVMTAARRFADRNLLTHYRGALSSENAVLNFLAENAARLPESVLREFSESFEKLPPLPSARNTIDADEAALRGQLWNIFAGMPDENGTPQSAAGDLRVSSMVALNRDDITIGFETADGESFSLRPGQKRNGYELTAVDLDQGRAFLRRGNEILVVELSARTVSSVAVMEGWQRVRNYLENSGLWDSELNQKIRATRGDPAKAFDEVLASLEHDFNIIRGIWNMPLERLPDLEFSAGASFVSSSAPLYIHTRRLEHRHRAQLELLAAALHHLLTPGGGTNAESTTIRQEGDRVVFISPTLSSGSPVKLEMKIPADD